MRDLIYCDLCGRVDSFPDNIAAPYPDLYYCRDCREDVIAAVETVRKHKRTERGIANERTVEARGRA